MGFLFPFIWDSTGGVFNGGNGTGKNIVAP